MTLWKSWWAFLLFIPFFLGFFWIWWKRKDPGGSFQYSTLSLLKKINPNWKMRAKNLPLYLSGLGIALAIFALARPQQADTKIKRNVEGIDIMLVLDVSDSMLIEDMLPENRLESSKKVMEDFVSKRNSDRIGLVIFSGESYTRIPLTLDYSILLNSLRAVKTTRNIKMGTAIGVALANGVARLRDSKAKSRVLILLTDGENNSGTIDPETALQMAKDYGIKIYTIGAGKDGQAQLPVFSQDVFGRQVKRYQPIHSTVNVPLLTRMAEETGGKFYRALETNGLESVFNDINKLEKTKIDVSQYTKYEELFMFWLKAAMVLLSLSFLLSESLLRRGP